MVRRVFLEEILALCCVLLSELTGWLLPSVDVLGTAQCPCWERGAPKYVGKTSLMLRVLIKLLIYWAKAVQMKSVDLQISGWIGLFFYYYSLLIFYSSTWKSNLRWVSFCTRRCSPPAEMLPTFTCFYLELRRSMCQPFQQFPLALSSFPRLTGYGIHHCFAKSMMGHEAKMTITHNFYADYYTMAGIALASCLAMCPVVGFLGRRGGLLLFMILTALASLLQLGLLNCKLETGALQDHTRLLSLMCSGKMVTKVRGRVAAWEQDWFVYHMIL